MGICRASAAIGTILEVVMFAIIAAILFGLALLLDLLNKSLGDVITVQTLTLAGLLFVALHLAGAGTWVNTRRRRTYRR